MILLNTSKFKLRLILPVIRKIHYDSFIDTRKGFELDMRTGFKYLKSNGNMGSSILISILGIGVDLYWGFPHGKR